jgi:hypothetical protein
MTHLQIQSRSPQTIDRPSEYLIESYSLALPQNNADAVQEPHPR